MTSKLQRFVCGLATLGLLLGASSCAYLRCQPHHRGPVAELAYSSGGIAPLLTGLSVYKDGSLELRPLGLPTACAKDPGLPGRLEPLLHSQEFRDTVAEIRKDLSHFAPSEYEQVWFYTPGPPFGVATDRVPPTLSPILRELETSSRRAFGRRLDFELMEKGPEP